MVDAVNELERGRAFFERRTWREAYESLSRAEGETSLDGRDLELLATAAYMLGRDVDYESGLERAHQAHLDSGEVLRAARCALWAGINLLARGEFGPGSGWLGRAERLVDREAVDCVERGYLLLPVIIQQESAGAYEAGLATAGEAVEIGERFGDADLVALARHAQGRALVKLGRLEEGLGLLDETMVAVTAGELSPIVTGLVYCSVIEGCQEVFELRRAREWTAALTRWCEEQPDLVSFTGKCLLHRAEIMQLQGAWPDALDEARRAGRRFAEGTNEAATGKVLYQEGEVQRLRGEFEAAEEAYREASRRGFEPQPGLALLRLVQGDRDAAAAAIRRAVGEATELLARVRLLPAYVEIMLALDDAPEARGACAELGEIAERFRSSALGAMVAQARGAVELADGDAWAALVSSRHALQTWQELEAPYEAACARVLVGLACRNVGDEGTGALELEAARTVFAELGAAPDLARVDSLHRPAAGDRHGLTPRELQVLRLVAAGNSNRAIAAELVISQKTVARHVSNIFRKLRVSSRSAATAYAYEHGLV